MLKSIMNRFRNWLQPPIQGLPKYGLLYFDHLLGLYDVLAGEITDPIHRQIFADAKAKRESGLLEWKDIYSCDLVLLKKLEIEQLRSKIQTLRSQYRNVAGQKEFDVYTASKPPDLSSTTDMNILRQDLGFLLNEFFLRYSLTSAREYLRSQLLKLAAIFTIVFLIIGAILVTLQSKKFFTGLFEFNPGVTTISVVIFAGMVGAFISMQQRIQSAPSEGDPIYSFSVLTHGIFGIFLAPISGAIFAVVLYLLFAGGILEGKVFPKFTSVQNTKVSVPATANPTEGSASATTTSGTTAQAPEPPPKPIMLADFSKETGPVSAVDYALLLIWAFIAGFAERFVPDALNKLVARSEAEKGTTT